MSEPHGVKPQVCAGTRSAGEAGAAGAAVQQAQQRGQGLWEEGGLSVKG